MAEMATSAGRGTTKVIDVNTIAAVPKYLDRPNRPKNELSLGLQFGMYLNIYDSHDWSVPPDWSSNKRISLRCEMQSELLKGLQSRQIAMLQGNNKDSSLTFVAKSTSPFVTGMGNEHPLENGFSFLNPYGLPYLPGSSIKGVLRRATEELIHTDWFSGEGKWSLMDIIHLFGLETLHTGNEWYQGFNVDNAHIEKYLRFIAPNQSDQQLKNILASKSPILELVRSSNLSARGVLNFWDCYPSGYRELEFDIMTPHQTDYYQKKREPHDSESPNPIRFLTIPPGSQFTFHISLSSDACQIREYMPGNWQEIIEKAFEHAFHWLGFGAKTAVGYGTMYRDKSKENPETESPIVKNGEMEVPSDPVERAIKELLDARPNKSEPETSFLVTALREGRWEGELKIEIAKHVKDKLQKKKEWRETNLSKNSKNIKIHKRTLEVMRWIKGE